jgi:transposase
MTKELGKDQRTKVIEFLRYHPRAYVGKEAGLQRFIEGVHWMMRSGTQWRELPSRYGQWNSVYKRFSRWCEHGIWTDMLDHFANEPDMEWLILDSSVVRAHPCAAGASKKTVVKQPRR